MAHQRSSAVPLAWLYAGLIAYASLTGRDIDLGLAKEVLRDLLQTEDKPITVEMIQKLVADHYNVKLADLKAKNNSKSVAEPRQIAMYIARTLTKHSLQEIGDAFGGRDHGTVIHACKAVDNMMEQDSTVRGSVEFLKNQLSR